MLRSTHFSGTGFGRTRTGVYREDDRERLGRHWRIVGAAQGFVDDVVDPRHHGEEQDEVVAVGVELHRLVELRIGKEPRGPRGGEDERHE